MSYIWCIWVYLFAPQSWLIKTKAECSEMFEYPRNKTSPVLVFDAAADREVRGLAVNLRYPLDL